MEEAAVGDRASVPHPPTHTYTHTCAHGRTQTTGQAVSGQEEGRVSATHPERMNESIQVEQRQFGAPDCNVKGWTLWIPAQAP